MILTPIRSSLARLTVHGGTAEGRFLTSGAYFMPHRAAPDSPATPIAPTHPATEPVWPRRDPQLPSSIVWDHQFRFVIDLVLPDLICSHGRAGMNDVVLAAPDGSHARHSPTGELHQAGPRRLWDEIETTHRNWREWGNPPRERFGLTATQQSQWAWLDEPDGPFRWPIGWPTTRAAPSDPQRHRPSTTEGTGA